MRGIFSLIGLVGTIFFLQVSQATIYGKNSLQDIIYTPAPIAELSKSVAVLVNSFNLKKDYSFSSRVLLDSLVCEEESFTTQPVTSTCTGFLISDRHIMTASHCLNGLANLRTSAKWVFDYKYENSEDETLTFSDENVYTSMKTLGSSYINNLDYTIIELDRPVSGGRKPLNLNPRPEGLSTHYVFAISSPRGLPLKYSEGQIRSVEQNHFITNIDLMRGSSGAPVFNDRHEVIGIVASGDYDYETQEEPFCNKFKVCREEECRGEFATAIKDIPFAFDNLGLLF